MHLKMLDPVKFLDGCEKYWKLVSEAFWEKSVPFLKYQLLNIIKTKGRTVWKEQEDALLKEAYKYFILYQANTKKDSGMKSLNTSTSLLMDNTLKPQNNAGNAGKIT